MSEHSALSVAESDAIDLHIRYILLDADDDAGDGDSDDDVNVDARR
jgi:hypothetical protein